MWFIEQRLRTTNEAFFHKNPKLLGLGRQFGQMNFGAFGALLADLSAPIFGTASPSSMSSINQPIFQEQTKPLHPNPKYFLGVGI